MAKQKLLIVESPGKLKTLRAILGPGWRLEASVGHTTELAQDGPKRLGFELKDGRVHARYVPRGPRGKKVLKRLREAVRDSEMVYLAMDPDREGEAIAWHLVEQLKLRAYQRIAYTQITREAVRRALEQPAGLNLALVQAQRARQCLDKLVGFEVSPLLWRTIGARSAGRVQSATLHLVCLRECERLAFKPEDYWLLRASYGQGFEAIYEPPPSNGELTRVSSSAEADRIEAIARSNPHRLRDRTSKEELRKPPPPFVTSSLQQAAGARFRFSPKRTMELAQDLYEGIGGKGLITYMRTDAVTLSPEFVSAARDWLRTHAPHSLAVHPPKFFSRSGAQEAHEAIRPTSVELTPQAASSKLEPDLWKLYSMIWERAMASQCRPARIQREELQVDCAGTLWRARGSVIAEPGYLKFWDNVEEEKRLPKLDPGAILDLRELKKEKKTTEPPSRYSEPKLIQHMEKLGIGRPSTYASTLSTLKDREYIVLEKNLVTPTPLGMRTDEALSRGIPELVDTEFTARMEESLDRIAEGALDWERFLVGWNETYLVPALGKAREAIRAFAGELPPEEKPQRGPGLAALRDEAEKIGKRPICSAGHGSLKLLKSKKGILYWKCGTPGCESIAWWHESQPRKSSRKPRRHRGPRKTASRSFEHGRDA